MSLSPQADPLLPEESRGDILPVDRIGAELVRTGISYWRSLKCEKPFPSRSSLMSCLSPRLQAHCILVEALEGGADYEYRFVGGELVKGFHVDFTGRRLSSVIEFAPKFGLGLRMMYEMVRASGEPLGYHGWVGNDLSGAGFVYHENVVLPLGDDGVVDHLAIISALVLRPDSTAA